jgi:hypothetical protein
MSQEKDDGGCDFLQRLKAAVDFLGYTARL